MHTSHVVKVVSRFHCSFSFYHGHLEFNQNTWDFTKLGHIKDTIHLKEVLGKGSVQVTLLMK